MTKSKTEGWWRLGVGVILNACLWPVFTGLSRWSSYDREYRLALIGGALAAAALISVVPIFWRGHAWQTPFAFLLLWLPGVVLFGVVQFIISRL
jgi:hypothetical protein